MNTSSYSLEETLTGRGTFYYFSYGSNLLKERLKIKNPTAVFVSIGKLEDYKLAFKGRKIKTPMAWRGAPATIVEAPDDHLWGVIWQLNIADIQSLDRQESIYKPIAVGVKDPDGKLIVCRTYAIVSDRFEIDLPSPQYLDVIQKGAKQNNLPDKYVETLSTIQHNGNTKHVELYEDVLKLISSAGS